MLYSVFYHGLLRAALLFAAVPGSSTELSRKRPPAVPPASCRQSLLLACRQMSNLPQGKETVAHMQFTSHTFFRAPDQKKMREVITQTTLYAQDTKVFFQTPQATLWQDGKYVAMVTPSQRLIYLTRVPPKQGTQLASAQFGILRDSLIQRGTLSQCQPVALKGKSYQRIVLQPMPADQTRYHVTSLSFLLDSDSRIKELTVHYPAGSLAARIVYSIEKQEFIASSSKLPANARTMVVDENNHPLKAYAGYRVVDHTEYTRLSH